MQNLSAYRLSEKTMTFSGCNWELRVWFNFALKAVWVDYGSLWKNLEYLDLKPKHFLKKISLLLPRLILSLQDVIHEFFQEKFNYIWSELVRPRSCHFLQGDMNNAVPGDPIFGIGHTASESKEVVPSIPNIGVTVKRWTIDQHIAFQKKPWPSPFALTGSFR